MAACFKDLEMAKEAQHSLRDESCIDPKCSLCIGANAELLQPRPDGFRAMRLDNPFTVDLTTYPYR